MTEPAPSDRPAVIELRQYTLRPGRRDELIELFDREFVESQEEAGIAVLGQFRDLDAPERFVWLRGFPDMAARQRALTAFYDGPVWAEHGPRANNTMLDSDNVLLLRPVSPIADFAASLSERPPTTAPAPDGFVAATVWSLPPGGHVGTERVLNALLPVLRETGPAPLAVLTTETAHNTFPRLPVRTGENVVAVLAPYPDEAAHRRHLADVRADPRVRDAIRPAPEVLRLAPTGRSLMR